LVAALAALITRMVLRTPAQVAAKQESVQDQLFTYGNATAQVLRMRGNKVQPGETPMLFARRMDKLNAGGVPITPLWRAMTLSNYSRRNPTQKLAEQAQEIFQSVYQPQPFYVKLRFLLAAAFRKDFYRMLETPVEHVEPKRMYQLPMAKNEKKGKTEKHGPAAPTGQAFRERQMKEQQEIDRTVDESLSYEPSAAQTPHPADRPERSVAPETAKMRPQPPAPAATEEAQARILSRGEMIGALQRQQLSGTPEGRSVSQPARRNAGQATEPSQRMLVYPPMPENTHNNHPTPADSTQPVRRRRRQE